MKPVLWLLAATAATFGVSRPAMAECEVTSVSVTGGQLAADYDGLQLSDLRLNAPLRIVANRDCRRSGVAVVILADGGASQPIGSSILLESPSGVLRANLRAGRSSQARPSGAEDGDKVGNVQVDGTGGGLDSELILTVPAGQDVAPGDYKTRVRLAATEKPGRAGDSLDIIVRVRPFVGLAAGSGTTLDLGVLSSGSQAQNAVTFRTYANTPYRIVLSSDNDWKLERERTSGSVAYDPMLGDVALTGGSERVARYGNVPGGSEVIRFNAKVGDLPRVPAGRYSDWVTVRIAADLGR